MAEIKTGDIVERKQKHYKGIKGEVLIIRKEPAYFSFGRHFPSIIRAKVLWEKQGGSRAKSTLLNWVKVSSLYKCKSKKP